MNAERQYLELEILRRLAEVEDALETWDLSGEDRREKQITRNALKAMLTPCKPLKTNFA